MENNPNPSKRLHPLLAGAAISVMLASLTGVAALTGMIPTSHSGNAPEAAVAPAPQVASASVASLAAPQAAAPVAVEEAPQAKAAREPAPHVEKAARSQPVRVAQAPVCTSCGRVESVQEIKHEAAPSGVGMVAGAVLGGVLGNQVGGGNGRKIATVAGAVGGGYAGNEIEKHTRGTTTYQVRVRMDDGHVRTFPYSQQPNWSAGDRVRVVDGHLTSRA